MTSIRNILLGAVAAVALSAGLTACERSATLADEPEIVIPDAPRDTAGHVPVTTMGS